MLKKARLVSASAIVVFVCINLVPFDDFPGLANHKLLFGWPRTCCTYTPSRQWMDTVTGDVEDVKASYEWDKRALVFDIVSGALFTLAAYIVSWQVLRGRRINDDAMA